MPIENPLVSIVVITYNSSEFVIETLESAKAQTYQNIELIVSDDCSKDNTVEVCRNWMEKNKNRFVRTELITVEKNTGTPSNCNRGYHAAQGEWVKGIAGDDILNINCVIKFIDAVKHDNGKHSILFCNKSTFQKDTTQAISVDIAKLIEKTPTKQLVKYASTRPTIAPFMFIKKQAILELDGFDESYRLLEDSPFFFKALKNNYSFQLVNEDLVYYRISEQSTSNSTLPNKAFNNELQKFNKLNITPFLLSKGLIFNILKINIEYNFQNKALRQFSLKIINKLAQIERKILYSV